MTTIRHANVEHHRSLTRNERIGVWVTDHVGTMQCAYVFVGMGIAALVGAITNWEVGLLCGLASSQVIQLVLLPVIMVGTNVQTKHDAIRADIQFEMEQRIERDMSILLNRACGAPISPYAREALKTALKDNRTNSPYGGRGDLYWESVAQIAETFFTGQTKTK